MCQTALSIASGLAVAARNSPIKRDGEGVWSYYRMFPYLAHLINPRTILERSYWLIDAIHASKSLLYPDPWQRFAEIVLPNLWQRFPGRAIRQLSGCTSVPRREGKSMGGLPLFNIGIETDKDVAKDKIFALKENRTGVPGRRPSTLSTRLLLHQL